MLIDVGGVIVLPDFTPVAVEMQRLDRPTDTDELEKAHYRAVGSLDTAFDTGSSELVEAYVKGYMDALGDLPLGSGVAGAVDAAFRTSWSKTIDSTVEGMRKLHADGHTLAIVSNSLGHVEEGLRGICQVGEGPGAVVDALIDSFHVGVEKPDPRIFQIALTAIGGEAQDAVHVGDTIAYDVRGARAAGIRAFHFDPWAMCTQHDDHEHIASVPELVP